MGLYNKRSRHGQPLPEKTLYTIFCRWKNHHSSGQQHLQDPGQIGHLLTFIERPLPVLA